MNFYLLKIIIITVIDASIFLINIPIKGINYYFYKSKIWSKRLLKAAKIKLITIGSENINPNESYVFISNHTSLLDIPSVLGGLNNNIRIIYKKELQKIPIFGYALKKSPFICIDRDNVKNAMDSLKQAIEAVKTGESVLIFPEGTRSLTGELGEFKRGAMMLAIKSGKPIVPLTIIGAFENLPAKSSKLKNGDIKVIVGKPVILKPEMNKTDEKEVLDNLRNWINDTLLANKLNK